MKRIALSASKPKGRPPRAYALVDDADFDALVEMGTWQLMRNGYAVHTIPGGTTIYMHRVLLGLPPGDPRVGDHIDRVRLNNQRANLRVTDWVGNARNRTPRGHPTPTLPEVTELDEVAA